MTARMTAEEARALADVLRHDPETGRLYWLPRTEVNFSGGSPGGAAATVKGWNARWAGKEAFTASNSDGYKHGVVWGRSMKAHRVIWALHYGEWPSQEIDHANGNRGDNRISNLRLSSRHQNCQNTSSRQGASSRFLGVSLHKSSGRWQASCRVNGKPHYIGLFDREDDAAAAYVQKSKELYGQFAGSARAALQEKLHD